MGNGKARALLTYALPVVLVGALICSAWHFTVHFTSIMGTLPDHDSLSYSDGWQITAMLWALGVVGVLVLGATLWWSRRVWPRLGGYGSIVALVGLLVGYGVSPATTAGAHKALEWAGDHTSEHAADEARLKQLLIEDKLHPGVMHTNKPPASAALTALMLTPARLGAYWYPMQEPLVTADPSSTGLDAASTRITYALRNRNGWDLKSFIIERATRYASELEAVKAVKDQFVCQTPQLAKAVACVNGPTTKVLHTEAAGVVKDQVMVGGDYPYLMSVFRRGTTVWYFRVTLASLAQRTVDGQGRPVGGSGFGISAVTAIQALAKAVQYSA